MVAACRVDGLSASRCPATGPSSAALGIAALRLVHDRASSSSAMRFLPRLVTYRPSTSCSRRRSRLPSPCPLRVGLNFYEPCSCRAAGARYAKCQIFAVRVARVADSASYPVRRRDRPRARHSRDNAKLKVADYLSGRADGATRNELSHKSGVRQRGDREFKALLEEMVGTGWLDRRATDLAGGITVYTLAAPGREALARVRELVADGHPLSSLAAFEGL